METFEATRRHSEDPMHRLQPFQDLLDAGLPRLHIVSAVRRHIEDLRALPDNTEQKSEAVTEAEAFLASIEGTEH